MAAQCSHSLCPVSQSIGRQLCFVLRTSLAGELTQNIAKQERVTRMGRVLKTRYSDQLKELVMISLRKTRLGWGSGGGKKGVIQEQSVSIMLDSMNIMSEGASLKIPP